MSARYASGSDQHDRRVVVGVGRDRADRGTGQPLVHLVDDAERDQHDVALVGVGERRILGVDDDRGGRLTGEGLGVVEHLGRLGAGREVGGAVIALDFLQLAAESTQAATDQKERPDYQYRSEPARPPT